MMKWGRKKKKDSSSTASNSSSSSSVSRSHLISHVLPVSWLTKSKQSSSEKPGNLSKSTTQMRDQSHFQEQSSRFYTQDDDGFWRLSFGDQSENSVMKEVKTAATMKKRSTQKPNCEKPQLGRVQETGEVERSSSLRRTYRRIIEATSELQRELDEVKDGYRKSVEKEMPELELFQVMQMMGRSNNVGRMHGKEDDKREWERVKEEKIKEVLSKNEKQRKSVHIGGNCNGNGYGNGNNKVRTVRSPRTPSYSKAETCKIRAIERLRREKMKKKMKEMAVLDEQAAALGSFAVVKCSCEPDEEFRESMIDMIVAKRIRRPEQLEELLACYLTLNADEYHDLIIKVFRQVWCELRQQGYYNYRGL